METRLTDLNLFTAGRLLALLALAAVAGWAQGTPPGGTPPGGTTASVTYKATYKLDGGSATQAAQTYTATADDTSAVWVTNSGALTLTNPTITTGGNTSSQDNSSFYGLNAGLLATASGKVTVTGGTITTSGTGANGAFAVGSGASVTLSGVTIKASANGGHGVMATDRGGGTITATGGTVVTTGQDSPGIYSTGDISVTGGTISASGAEAAVIEGANKITLTDTSLSTTKQKWGVMIYQSMSGDAEGNKGTFTMTGGSLAYSAASGPQFYVTNTTGIITLKGVNITTKSGVLLKAAAGNWGKSGSNGGHAVVTRRRADDGRRHERGFLEFPRAHAQERLELLGRHYFGLGLARRSQRLGASRRTPCSPASPMRTAFRARPSPTSRAMALR